MTSAHVHGHRAVCERATLRNTPLARTTVCRTHTYAVWLRQPSHTSLPSPQDEAIWQGGHTTNIVCMRMRTLHGDPSPIARPERAARMPPRASCIAPGWERPRLRSRAPPHKTWRGRRFSRTRELARASIVTFTAAPAATHDRCSPPPNGCGRNAHTTPMQAA